MSEKETTPPESPPGSSVKKTTNPVLPPLHTDEKTSEEPPPVEGISPALKRGIILFTAITVLIFGIFGTMLVKKLLGPGKENAKQDHEIIKIADRLHEAGLHHQALNQYEKFLAQPGIGKEARAHAAFTAGKLYLELDNCPEGMVYFFQSQVISPKAPWAAELNSHIDHCLTRLKSPPTQ